jgi:hypothetical protein
VVGPVFEQGCLLRGGAGDGDAGGALSFGDLDGGDAYAAAGCCNEDEIAFGEVAERDEAAICGEVLHPDGGTFFVGEPGRIFCEGGGGNDGDFAIDSVLVEPEKAGDGAGCLSDPARIDAGADGFDDAGGFVAVFRGEDGCLKVSVVAEHDLGPVEADRFDAEADLAVGWFGKGEVVELQDFGTAYFVEADDLYRGGHARSWRVSS